MKLKSHLEFAAIKGRLAKIAHGWPQPGGVPLSKPYEPGVHKPGRPSAPKLHASADRSRRHHHHDTPRPAGAPHSRLPVPGVHHPHHPGAPKPHGVGDHGSGHHHHLPS